MSVFDESLLGVSGDLSRDIRDFYLADARGQGRAARDLAATRVGAVTVAELVKKAEAAAEGQGRRWPRSRGWKTQLTGCPERWKAGKLAVPDVVTLVRLTGLEVYLAQPCSGNRRADVDGAARRPRWPTCPAVGDSKDTRTTGQAVHLRHR